jgi:hypothetical protein
MEPTRSKIKFPEKCATGGGSEAEGDWVLVSARQDWEGVGQLLCPSSTSGVRAGNGVTPLMSRHVAHGGVPCLLIILTHHITEQVLLNPPSQLMYLRLREAM